MLSIPRGVYPDHLCMYVMYYGRPNSEACYRKDYSKQHIVEIHGDELQKRSVHGMIALYMKTDIMCFVIVGAALTTQSQTLHMVVQCDC